LCAAPSLATQGSKNGDSEIESDDSDEGIAETDQDRRNAMLDASQDADLDNLKYEFPDNFDFNLPSPRSAQDACGDIPTNTSATAGPLGSKGKDKAHHEHESMCSLPKFNVCYYLTTKPILHRSSRFIASIKAV
jgi:hypothetical protein